MRHESGSGHDADENAILDAEARARNQIGQALHDDLQQHLHSIQVHIDLARDRLATDGTADHAVEVLVDLRRRTDDALLVLRDVIRGLWSADHDDGLTDGLDRLVRRMQRVHGLHVALQISPTATAVEDTTLTALLVRATNELLFNVAKHAGTTNAEVHVEQRGTDLVLQVRDDGHGLDDASGDGSPGTGLGVTSLRDSLRPFGGTVDLSSTPGRGSVATVRVPVS